MNGNTISHQYFSTCDAENAATKTSPSRALLGYELLKPGDQNINRYARVALREQDHPRHYLAIRRYQAEYRRRYAGGSEANPWDPGTTPLSGKALPSHTPSRPKKAITPTLPANTTRTQSSRSIPTDSDSYHQSGWTSTSLRPPQRNPTPIQKRITRGLFAPESGDLSDHVEPTPEPRGPSWPSAAAA